MSSGTANLALRSGRLSNADTNSAWRLPVKMSDSQLYAALANLLDGAGVARILPRNVRSDEFDITVATEVHDNHRGDSPDVILWLNLEIVHPRLPVLKLRIPVPMEGERAGIGAAM